MPNIHVEFPELEIITERLTMLEEKMQLFLDTGGRNVVFVSDIAKREGCSESQLRKGGAERYLLPRFGESGYPSGRTRWDVDEYLAWSKMPKEERREAYREHLRQQAEAYRKRKAQ